MCPASGVNTRRGTQGSMGLIISNTGVNLDDDEWGMLTFNFENIKEAFTGRKDALKDIFTRLKQDPSIVKVYKAEWYLNGKMIVTPECGHEFFSRGKAEISGSESFTRWLAPGSEQGVSWEQAGVRGVRRMLY